MSTSNTTAQSTIDKIREMFKAGRILTSCGAAEAYETADLRKIISVLRAKGMDIVDRWKKSSTGKKHKEYFLREFTPKDEPAVITPYSPPPFIEPEVVPPVPVVPQPLPSPYQQNQQRNIGHQPTLFDGKRF